MTRGLLATLWLSALVAPLAAEVAPASPSTAASPSGPIAIGSNGDTVVSGYDDGGRRDPFVSLVVPKHVPSDAPRTSRPLTGLAAVSLADVIVRGIVHNGTSTMVILESSDHKSFVAHPKDRLLDASVQAIDASGVVFVEAVDAAGRNRQIRKTLRAPAEDGR